MELIVICGAGLVIYCGWLAAVDEVEDWKRSRARQTEVTRSNRICQRKIRVAVSCPRGGAVARWPVPLRDSF